MKKITGKQIRKKIRHYTILFNRVVFAHYLLTKEWYGMDVVEQTEEEFMDIALYPHATEEQRRENLAVFDNKFPKMILKVYRKLRYWQGYGYPMNRKKRNDIKIGLRNFMKDVAG